MISTRTLFLQGNATPLKFGRMLGAGGEGAVYEISDDPTKLVKLFHKPDSFRQAKVSAMVAMQALVDYQRLAWPQRLVVDEKGNVCGYVMRRVRGVSLVPLTAPLLRHAKLPHWRKNHVARVAHDLAALFGVLERHGVYVADLNLLNFIVDPNTAEVCGIDCDAYSVTNSRHRYPSSVFSADLQVPEILTGAVDLNHFGVEQFRGAAAILFFVLLTEGGQPYATRDGLSVQDAIIGGRYILGGRGVARGCTNDVVWRRYLGLPRRTCALLKRALIDGHSRPEARPTFSEWQSAFRAYFDDLQTQN